MAIDSAINGFLSKETWIPVQLALYAEKQNIIELLKLYVAFKLSCSGKIKARSSAFSHIKQAIGIKSPVTIRNHLKALKTLNWVGYNEASGYYFIRSFDRICEDLRISAKTRVYFHSDYFQNFRAYVFAAIVGYKIRALAYAKKKGIEEVRLVPTYWADTRPSLAPQSFTYNCLSLPHISILISKSKSRCSEIMDLAEKAGFIKTKKKLVTVNVLPKNNFIRRGLEEMFPKSYHRFKIKVITRGRDIGKVRIIEQMPDEITTLLRYKRHG